MEATVIKLAVGTLSLIGILILFILLFSPDLDPDPPLRDPKKCPLGFDPACAPALSCREGDDPPPCEDAA